MPNFGFSRWRKPPVLWRWFKKMQERALYFNVPCAFPFNGEGYQQFAGAVGPVPDGMRSPTVGRYDHDQGYVFDHTKNRWNFRWQEKAENSSESATRNKLAQLGNRRSAISSRRNSLQVAVCPRCGQEGRLLPMKRWHFDKCTTTPA